MNKVLISLASLALGLSMASCSSDEPNTPTPAPGNSGTVLFSDGTSLSITSPGSRAGETMDEDDVNAACNLYLPGIPEIPTTDIVNLANPPQDFQSWSLGFPGNADNGWQTTYTDVLLPAGSDFTITGAPIAKDIYVQGNLTVTNYEPKGGRIIVMPGGSLILSKPSISYLTILNYGKLIMTEENYNIDGTASLLTNESLTIAGKLNAGARLYVHGDLNCNELDFNNGAQVHITGKTTLAADRNVFNNQAEVCMEGGLHAKVLELNSASNFHIGCGLFVSEKLKLDNEILLSTSYVSSPVTVINNSTHLSLTDGGLASLGDLTLGNNTPTFTAPANGSAMVECNRGELLEGYNLETVFPANIYFNYQTFFVTNQGQEQVTVPGWTADHQHEVTIGTKLINVATANAYVEGGCNPGFKANEGEKPETPDQPEIDPSKDEITIHVPSDLDRNLYLESDDFALRIDGQYVPMVAFEGNHTTIDGVSVSEQGFDVNVSGLKNIQPGKDYTYELYLWVKDTSWNALTPEQKQQWVEGDGYGTDITSICPITMPEGFEVRRNVYRGLAGHQDTPYIKVSIHVIKK